MFSLLLQVNIINKLNSVLCSTSEPSVSLVWAKQIDDCISIVSTGNYLEQMLEMVQISI